MPITFCDSCQEILPITYNPRTDNYHCIDCAEPYYPESVYQR